MDLSRWVQARSSHSLTFCFGPKPRTGLFKQTIPNALYTLSLLQIRTCFSQLRGDGAGRASATQRQDHIGQTTGEHLARIRSQKQKVHCSIGLHHCRKSWSPGSWASSLWRCASRSWPTGSFSIRTRTSGIPGTSWTSSL